MEERLKNIFRHIVEEYISQAEPVGSNLIVQKYFSDLSPATVRNEMARLEELGLIFQPHISAGRIPTEEGWQIYLQEMVENRELLAKEKNNLNSEVAKISQTGDAGLKSLAKNLAQLSGNAVLIGFAPTDVYYTGLANLFSQPEFNRRESVYSLSAVIDHLDEIMSQIFYKIDEEVKILAGEANPFGSDCGVILGRYHLLSQKESGILGILGPVRMNYNSNISLVKHAINLLNQS